MLAAVVQAGIPHCGCRCTGNNPKPVLCAALIDRHLALGMATGHLYVYAVDTLLDALERTDSHAVTRLSRGSSLSTMLSVADAIDGAPASCC